MNCYHADHLSARVTTDTSGNIAGQQAHYPFGESWYASSTTTKWQFTRSTHPQRRVRPGQASGVYPERSRRERDTESGNDYATFRYHVNRLGRFAPPVPLAGSIANPQSLNRYAYVLNDRWT